jgi:hypothetical protein
MTTENLEKNKEIVRQFNKEVIEQGNLDLEPIYGF